MEQFITELPYWARVIIAFGLLALLSILAGQCIAAGAYDDEEGPVKLDTERL